MATDRINKFLNGVLKELMSLLNAECGSLFLFDQQRKELVLNTYQNANPIDIVNIKKRVGEIGRAHV
jgi:hypothetical protein